MTEKDTVKKRVLTDAQKKELDTGDFKTIQGNNPSGREWMIRIHVECEWHDLDKKTKEPLPGEEHHHVQAKLSPEILNNIFGGHGWSWVGQLEKGKETGKEHYQIFLIAPNSIRLSGIRTALGEQGIHAGYIRKKYTHASRSDCTNYVTKDETRIDGPYGPYGDADFDAIPEQGQRHDLETLYEAITVDGKTPDEILLDDHLAILAHGKLDWLDRTFSAYQKSRYADSITRDVTVHYLYGAPGVGKSTFVLNNYARHDVCYVTDYAHPMDGYTNQKVLVFDEFTGQIPMQTMNAYLDRFVVDVARRYSNAVSLWTEVWVISNYPISEIYRNSKTEFDSGSFTRRFTDITFMDSDREFFDAADGHDLSLMLQGKARRGRHSDLLSFLVDTDLPYKKVSWMFGESRFVMNDDDDEW